MLKIKIVIVNIKYLTAIFLLSILFIMFCKCNIYCVISILILVLTIDILNIHKLSYILPSLVIIIGFFYEYINYNGTLLQFFDN